jgi:hypothetical protein
MMIQKVSNKKKALATTNVPFQKIAYAGDNITHGNSMNVQNKNKNDKPLKGLLCLVDTINEDGM